MSIIPMKNLKPSALGLNVANCLSDMFKDVLDYDFTARLENRLDDIASGGENWIEFLNDLSFLLLIKSM